jgi:hypothetical protein
MSNSGHPNGPSIVGNYYKVGKKIGEGSFGVIYEGENPFQSAINSLGIRSCPSVAGTNLLNSSQVAIKFVCTPLSTAAGSITDIDLSVGTEKGKSYH